MRLTLENLDVKSGDFTRVHGFHKPDKNQQIIFYCRSGKRSTTALDLAKKRGYKAFVSLRRTPLSFLPPQSESLDDTDVFFHDDCRLRNYEGSYLDWAAKASQDD
jgi:rhodanese-related sulfurtransferase